MTVGVPDSASTGAADDWPGDPARLRRAVEAAGHGTWEWDAASGAVHWDERVERQFGLAPGEFAGTVEGWVALVWPPDRDQAIAEFQRAVGAKDSCYFEHRVQWPDGTVHWIAAHGRVLLNATDRVTGLAGLSRDVTERRQDQEQRDLAHWRQTVLNRAGDLLNEVLDVTVRLNTLARDVLSELADGVAIHLVDDNDNLQLVAAWHRDRDRESALRALMQVGPDQPPDCAAIITGREPRLILNGVDVSWLDQLSVLSAYCVPLNRGNRTFGAITLIRTDEPAWTEDDLRLVRRIGRRAAVAAENAHLFTREQAARRTVVDLQRITAGLAAAASLAEVARIVVADARKSVDADGALMVQVLGEQLSLLGSVGTDPAELARWQGLSLDAPLANARAVRAGMPLFSSSDPQSGLPQSGSAEAFAVLPLTQGPRVLGAIRYAWTAPRRLAPGDWELMLSVAQQAALALDRAALLAAEQTAREEAEKSHRRIVLLAEVSDTLATSLDVDAVLAKLVHLVVPRLADQCTVDLVDAPGEPPRLLAVAAITPRLEELLHLTDSYLPRRRNPKTMIGKALATGQPVLAAQVSEEHLRRISICEEQAQYYLDMELVSGLIVPLVARGQVLGALSMFTTRASGRVFGPDTVDLMTELLRRATLSVDNARLFTREHEAAETLQRSLLPDLPDLPDLDVAARYLPAATHAGVGGDLFDIFALPDGATAIAIGDVMGHDMQAAAAMGQLRSVLRSYAWEGAAPGVVLDRMDQLVQSFEMAQLASALYARLEPGPDPETRLLRYSNAGHLPPLLQYPDGKARYLEDGHSVLIGVPGGHARAEGVEPMPRGSTLLLYTDGLLEIRHRPLEPGLDELLATVQAHDPAAGAEALCAKVLATIEGQELRDDVALLAVRLR
ncbi:MAG: hypothetical protein DLM59_06760 [Pseudonocardiales bacterium]|nr:MAG: hypothetical protein DLM59_06760 [Pseudonocardiales bacterium]